MSSNRITVSDDGMEMTISSPNGQRTKLRSARPGGFTESDIENAGNYRVHNMVPHQVNRAWRRPLGRRILYAHFNVGPPTWWLPRLQVRPNTVMVGWLRALFAVSWDKSGDK